MVQEGCQNFRYARTTQNQPRKGVDCEEKELKEKTWAVITRLYGEGSPSTLELLELTFLCLRRCVPSYRVSWSGDFSIALVWYFSTYFSILDCGCLLYYCNLRLCNFFWFWFYVGILEIHSGEFASVPRRGSNLNFENAGTADASRKRSLRSWLCTRLLCHIMISLFFFRM